eukprot:6192483-Pleurochrysis_carterae.AAC.4
MGAPVWRPPAPPFGAAGSGAARCQNGPCGLSLSASDVFASCSWTLVDGCYLITREGIFTVKSMKEPLSSCRLQEAGAQLQSRAPLSTAK